jgi:alkaline phosphatase
VPEERRKGESETQEPAAVYVPAARGTVTDVLAAGRGPGSEALHGFVENTTIFQIIRDQL